MHFSKRRNPPLPPVAKSSSAFAKLLTTRTAERSRPGKSSEVWPARSAWRCPSLWCAGTFQPCSGGEDLDEAWTLFRKHFNSTVSSYIDSAQEAELEKLLQYMERSTRKRLNFFEAAYADDRLQIVDPLNRPSLSKEMSNRKLLSLMINQ